MSSDWRVSHFEYPNVMGGADDRIDNGDSPVWSIEPDQRPKSEQALREAQAREIGRLEGEAKARVEYEQALRREKDGIAEALRQFAVDRTQYFEQVEGEVVQLSLAIARKLLHREVQVDPDLLAGLVRYTLEKLRDGTQVKLRVHPAIVSGWQPLFGPDVQLLADDRLGRDTCLIETEIGTTAVSVDEQLKEIEQGLMDLLSHRPEKR